MGTTAVAWLTTSDVARLFNVTPERIRQLERAGDLPAIRTLGGQRIFSADEVSRVLREREGAATVAVTR